MMPSKSKEKARLIRMRLGQILEQKREEVAEGIRLKTKTLAEQTTELGARPVKCSMDQEKPKVTNSPTGISHFPTTITDSPTSITKSPTGITDFPIDITDFPKSTSECNFSFNSHKKYLTTHSKAFAKIATIMIIALGFFNVLNQFSSELGENANCPGPFPFNWICNKMFDAPKIVY